MVIRTPHSTPLRMPLGLEFLAWLPIVRRCCSVRGLSSLILTPPLRPPTILSLSMTIHATATLSAAVTMRRGISLLVYELVTCVALPYPHLPQSLLSTTALYALPLLLYDTIAPFCSENAQQAHYPLACRFRCPRTCALSRRLRPATGGTH